MSSMMRHGQGSLSAMLSPVMVIINLWCLRACVRVVLVQLALVNKINAKVICGDKRDKNPSRRRIRRESGKAIYSTNSLGGESQARRSDQAASSDTKMDGRTVSLLAPAFFLWLATLQSIERLESVEGKTDVGGVLCSFSKLQQPYPMPFGLSADTRTRRPHEQRSSCTLAT